MAYWLTVYCRRSVRGIDAAALAAGLRGLDPAAPAGEDYQTLAERFDVDEAEVAPALAALTVVASAVGWEVRYRADPAARPLTIHVWSAPAQVAEELDEARDCRNPPPLAEQLLGAVVEIVALELGWSMLEDMGVVLADEAARFLAQRGDGVVADDEARWRLVVDGAWHALVDDDTAGRN
ncbi:MAG: hypothetical protein R3B06_28270 [Kofleriaceae bacterium]